MYAAKLYSEHPVGIWPIDDDFPYISLITNQQRTFEGDSPYVGWTIINGTANDSLALPDIGSPFDSSIYAGIEGDVPVSNGTYIEAKSPDTFIFSDCSEELETFCISAYVYQDSIYASEYEIGYEYYDDATSSWIEVFTVIPTTNKREWVHIQDTFLIQQFDSDYCHIIFRAKVNTGGSSGDYDFIFNGITVGQWSEPFTSKSLGGRTETAPASSGLSNKVVPSDQYGILSDNAYFVCEDGKALAKNKGIPMIFGSENVTKIYASSDGSPSFIFPNKEFFTTNGISKDFTLEFWIKTRPSTKQSRRIVGPIDTNDGVYVSEGFITLVIDGKFSSHNVSYWYRPMLVHIYLKGDTFYMLINGEQVAQVTVDKTTVSLSESDWLGFYSYEDINLMEIDCISIFPYAIPLQVARKRFVWGQGTDPLELINDSFDGEEAIVNFANANYTVNKVYPDMERWDAGYYSNLIANTNSISVPQYALPIVYLGERDIVEWYSDNKELNDLLYPSEVHAKFISFRPSIESSSWVPTTGTNWTEPCYLNFPTLTFLSNPLSSIYGIFEVESEVAEARPLIHIVNNLTGKRFEINITGYDITYEFDGQELSGTGFTVANDNFVVGMHMPTISEYFNYEIASFFGSPEVLSMFVGGDGTSTFEGKIYRIGFSDQANYESISEHFQENGIADNADEALLEGHYASYTLSPFFRYSAFFLDISVSSQWEEYFPLSSFASYIATSDGGSAYDLDYLQFNFGYPSLITILETSVDNPDWTYQELFEDYNDPIQKSYSILDNPILSGYVDYADLSANIVTEYQIDTSQSSLDAYVTFQLLAEGADEPLSSFTYTKNLTDSYTVYADSQNTNLDPYKAYRTKFGVIDGTVIYPPKTINFKSVAMVVHFQIEQDGIISNPLKVKNLEITSKSLNQKSLTAIGTKTGTPIYPYVKTGIYYSGKSKNPIMLGKQNLPYLYLTENTGIKVLDTDAEIEYGSLIPINKNKSTGYSLGAFQLFMKYDIFQEIGTTQNIFYLTHRDGDIEFTVTPVASLERFYISARDKYTKQEYPGISFYQNGIKVDNPYIEKYEWNVIAFSFEEPLDMNNFSGSLNLLSGCTYSNMSFFKSTGLNEFGVTVARTWEDVLYGNQEVNPANIVDWQSWYDENGVLAIPNEWKDVYVLEEVRRFSTTPKEIYSTYTGTNIIVIDDNTGMSVINDQFSVFSSTVWVEPSVILKPV